MYNKLFSQSLPEGPAAGRLVSRWWEGWQRLHQPVGAERQSLGVCRKRGWCQLGLRRSPLAWSSVLPSPVVLCSGHPHQLRTKCQWLGPFHGSEVRSIARGMLGNHVSEGLGASGGSQQEAERRQGQQQAHAIFRPHILRLNSGPALSGCEVLEECRDDDNAHLFPALPVMTEKPKSAAC